MKISDGDFLQLIYWARRYCDSRMTFAPSYFNQVYDRIVLLNPEIKDKDMEDCTLHSNGKFWPYAQDGMYDEEKGYFDATRK